VSAGQVALITGGASGIGLALGRLLASDGTRVVIADRDREAGERAAGELGATFVTMDVRDADAVRDGMRTAEAEHGRLDAVALNAGLTTGETAIEELTLERYRTVLAVNVDGVVFGVRESLPALRRAGGGCIVITASLSGLTPYPQDPIYAMTKHAVVGLTRSLAAPLSADRVTINCVCPGFVETPLIVDYLERFRAAGYPLLSADEVAGAAIAAMRSGRSGEAWVCQPGRAAEPYRFRGVPGPRVPDTEIPTLPG
jgi:NAD(P)-dependent dehydrogenase (short-subunit alcohol dehydrogenase family)